MKLPWYVEFMSGNINFMVDPFNAIRVVYGDGNARCSNGCGVGCGCVVIDGNGVLNRYSSVDRLDSDDAADNC